MSGGGDVDSAPSELHAFRRAQGVETLLDLAEFVTLTSGTGIFAIIFALTPAVDIAAVGCTAVLGAFLGGSSLHRRRRVVRHGRFKDAGAGRALQASSTGIWVWVLAPAVGAVAAFPLMWAIAFQGGLVPLLWVTGAAVFALLVAGAIATRRRAGGWPAVPSLRQQAREVGILAICIVEGSFFGDLGPGTAVVAMAVLLPPAAVLVGTVQAWRRAASLEGANVSPGSPWSVLHAALSGDAINSTAIDEALLRGASAWGDGEGWLCLRGVRALVDGESDAERWFLAAANIEPRMPGAYAGIAACRAGPAGTPWVDEAERLLAHPLYSFPLPPFDALLAALRARCVAAGGQPDPAAYDSGPADFPMLVALATRIRREPMVPEAPVHELLP